MEKVFKKKKKMEMAYGTFLFPISQDYSSLHRHNILILSADYKSKSYLLYEITEIKNTTIF